MRPLTLLTVKKSAVFAIVFIVAQNTSATDTSATVTATVTVDATIAIVETTRMDFGEFYMTGTQSGETDGVGAIAGTATQNDSAYLEISPGGILTASDGTTSRASTVTTVGSSQGVITITGAAALTSVYLSSSKLKDNLIANSNETNFFLGGNAFTFTDLTIDTNVDGFAETDNLARDDVLGTTNASGDLVVQTGGRIYSQNVGGGAANVVYPAGAYSGAYDILVSY